MVSVRCTGVGVLTRCDSRMIVGGDWNWAESVCGLSVYDCVRADVGDSGWGEMESVLIGESTSKDGSYVVFKRVFGAGSSAGDVGVGSLST